VAANEESRRVLSAAREATESAAQPYAPPILREIGPLTALTRGGDGTATDGGGGTFPFSGGDV
jgi:hypothetical protein